MYLTVGTLGLEGVLGRGLLSDRLKGRDLHLILAFALGVVERGICRAEEIVRAARLEGCDTDGYGAERPALIADREHGEHSLGENARARADGLGKDRTELVAAVACDEVGG